MRRVGEPKKLGKPYKVREGAYAILPRAGQLLVTFQAGMHNEFQLPGGGVDPGESAIAALHREVFEETGWRISNPRLYTVFRRYAFMPDYDFWAEKICKIYIARPIRKLGAPIELDHSAHWVSAKIAAQNLGNEGDRLAVGSIL